MKRIALVCLVLLVGIGVLLSGLGDDSGGYYRPTQEELTQWVQARDAAIEACAPLRPILFEDGTMGCH